MACNGLLIATEKCSRMQRGITDSTLSFHSSDEESVFSLPVPFREKKKFLSSKQMDLFLN